MRDLRKWQVEEETRVTARHLEREREWDKEKKFLQETMAIMMGNTKSPPYKTSPIYTHPMDPMDPSGTYGLLWTPFGHLFSVTQPNPNSKISCTAK